MLQLSNFNLSKRMLLHKANKVFGILYMYSKQILKRKSGMKIIFSHLFKSEFFLKLMICAFS